MRSTLKEQCASLTHHLVWAFRPCGCGSVCVVDLCVCVYRANTRGESDTVSLPGWQAALSPSSEWKPIWQITSSRQYAHPSHPPTRSPAPSQASSHCSVPVTRIFLSLFLSHLVLFFVTPLSPAPPPPSFSTTSGMIDPGAHAVLIKAAPSHTTSTLHFCLPGRNGGSQLSIFMSLALQVNCLRDSAVMNIRFEAGVEGEKLDEREIGDRRSGREKWSAEERKCWPCSQAPCFDSFCHSSLFFPLHLPLCRSSSSPLACCFLFSFFSTYSLFLHTYSPLTTLTPAPFSASFYPFIFSPLLSDDYDRGVLILLNKDQ